MKEKNETFAKVNLHFSGYWMYTNLCSYHYLREWSHLRWLWIFLICWNMGKGTLVSEQAKHRSAWIYMSTSLHENISEPICNRELNTEDGLSSEIWMTKFTFLLRKKDFIEKAFAKSLKQNVWYVCHSLSKYSSPWYHMVQKVNIKCFVFCQHFSLARKSPKNVTEHFWKIRTLVYI